MWPPIVSESSQSNPSAVFSELRDTFASLDATIDKGAPVTLIFTSGGEAVSLLVRKDHVAVQEPPRDVPRTGSDYKSLVAMVTHIYRFDLDEAQRDIRPHDVEASVKRRLARPASPVPSETDPLPNPMVRKGPFHDWTLEEDCTVSVGGVVICARRGFVTDFASIPRLFWPLMDTTELGITPATIHDLIYRAGGDVTQPAGDVTPATRFDREQADRIFDALMGRDPAVKPWRRWAAFHAVHLFGRSSWRGSRT